MAPARMISFIEEHATDCSVCRRDPDLKEDIKKITELILPESKIPKAVRLKSDSDEDADSEDNSDIDNSNEDDDSADDSDSDSDDDSLDEGDEEEELDLDDDFSSEPADD